MRSSDTFYLGGRGGRGEEEGEGIRYQCRQERTANQTLKLSAYRAEGKKKRKNATLLRSPAFFCNFQNYMYYGTTRTCTTIYRQHEIVHVVEKLHQHPTLNALYNKMLFHFQFLLPTFSRLLCHFYDRLLIAEG